MGNLPGTARVIEVIGVSNGDKDNEGKDDGDLHFGVLGLKMVGHKNEENWTTRLNYFAIAVAQLAEPSFPMSWVRGLFSGIGTLSRTLFGSCW